MHLLYEFMRTIKPDHSRTVESLQRRKTARRLRRNLRSGARDVMLMLLGILSAGFGLQGFLIPNGFIDGGVMGVALLTNRETAIPLPYLIVGFNLPFLYMGLTQLGKTFAVKSLVAIALLAIAVAIIPYPVATQDKVLVAVFGGFFLGAGIGLMIRGGGVIDGTEVLAIYLSRRSSLTVGDFILVFNVLIFSAAAYLLSVEVALYSILTYLAASKTVDFILEGIEEYTGVTIISSHSKKIIEMIKNDLGRGLTIYGGRKGYGKSGSSDQVVDIIFTVITRLEINRLTTEVERIDPQAFIVMQSIKDTKGGKVKRLPLKE